MCVHVHVHVCEQNRIKLFVPLRKSCPFILIWIEVAEAILELCQRNSSCPRIVTTCSVKSSEWVWSRSQVANTRLLRFVEAKSWQKSDLAWFYSNVAASLSFVLWLLPYKYKPVNCTAISLWMAPWCMVLIRNYYKLPSNKSCTWLVATPQLIIAMATIWTLTCSKYKLSVLTYFLPSPSVSFQS